ncbi:MAG: hypothetical protein PHQ39_10870 [Methanothrix soehngenii]|nr:hypothetical protein [Methanothrix soehngenii]
MPSILEMNINCRDGRFGRHENGLPEKTSRPEVDYALAAYSLFDEEIEDIRRMSLAGKREKAFWGGILARTVPEVGAWAGWCS